jgi:hypothetical protein
VVARINAQCERGARADAGFAADIWAAQDAGEVTSEEARLLVRSLLTAGLDTTVNGFANAVLASMSGLVDIAAATMAFLLWTDHPHRDSAACLVPGSLASQLKA